MDAMTYMDKLAALEDNSFGSKIAGDIVKLANEKLAALPASIATPESIARFRQIFGQANPQQARVFASRFRQLGNQDLTKVISRNPVSYGNAVAQAPIYSGAAQGSQVVQGFGPNRSQIRQQIFNKEVGR